MDFEAEGEVKGFYINGNSTASYNDIGRQEIFIKEEHFGRFKRGMKIPLRAHSVEIIQIVSLGQNAAEY